MKRNIIYLLVAVLCLAVLLPSCDQGGATNNTACEAHVDADANLFCDNCNIPVHTIVNSAPATEEEVPTVFAEIPADAKITSLFTTTPVDKNAVLSTGTTASDKWFTPDCITNNISELSSDLYLITYTTANTADPNNVTLTATTLVYNPDIAACVYSNSVTYGETATPNKYFNVGAVYAYGIPFAFEVATTSINAETAESTVTYSYYTLSGAEIATDLENDDIDASILNGEEFALTVDDTVYVIVDDKISYTFDEAQFVDRPRFDYVNEEKNLGYLVVDGYKTTVLVYDLTKWMSCTWAYELPAYDDVDFFFLANGNILLQTQTVVPSGSVNYDYTDGYTNYDLDYFVVDVNTKAATEIEFGYYIYDVDVADKETDAASVKNWIQVADIENKNITGSSMILAADDSLKIIGEYNATLPSVLVEDFELIAKDTFLATLYYGEGTIVRKLYSADGKEIATLPNSASIYDGFILINDTVYGFDMKPIYTLTETQSFTNVYDNYILIYDKGNAEENVVAGQYYLSTDTTAPVLVASNVTTFDEDGTTTLKVVQSYVSASDYNHFTVRTTTYDYVNPENNSTIYSLYNEKAQLVYSGETEIYNIYEGEGVYTIVFADGSVVVSK